jgi:hypothetical protein
MLKQAQLPVTWAPIGLSLMPRLMSNLLARYAKRWVCLKIRSLPETVMRKSALNGIHVSSGGYQKDSDSSFFI